MTPEQLNKLHEIRQTIGSFREDCLDREEYAEARDWGKVYNSIASLLNEIGGFTFELLDNVTRVERENNIVTEDQTVEGQGTGRYCPFCLSSEGEEHFSDCSLA